MRKTTWTEDVHVSVYFRYHHVEVSVANKTEILHFDRAPGEFMEFINSFVIFQNKRSKHTHNTLANRCREKVAEYV